MYQRYFVSRAPKLCLNFALGAEVEEWNRCGLECRWSTFKAQIVITGVLYRDIPCLWSYVMVPNFVTPFERCSRLFSQRFKCYACQGFVKKYASNNYFHGMHLLILHICLAFRLQRVSYNGIFPLRTFRDLAYCSWEPSFGIHVLCTKDGNSWGMLNRPLKAWLSISVHSLEELLNFFG